jgi:hypothetical protein
MPKITKSFIDKVQPPAKGYQIHWDDALKGYGLRVTAAGKKVFIAMGRVRGRPTCLTIGTYGVFTVDQARDKAREHLRSMRKGIDPRDVAKEEAATKVTLREVADAYLRDRPLRESTQKEIDRYPSSNSLQNQRAEMAPQRVMTQARVRGAVSRLMAASRLQQSPDKSPSGNRWIRAVDSVNGTDA